MGDSLEEKEHLLPEAVCVKDLQISNSKEADDDVLNVTKQSILKTREFCKSMEHVGKVSGDDCKVLGHALSKSSNHITEVQCDGITIYQEVKKSVPNKCNGAMPLSLESG